MKPIYYREGYKIQVWADYTYDQEGIWFEGAFENAWLRIQGKTITIKGGYCSDGASGPTLDTKCAIRAAIKHDAGYNLIRLGILPPESKKIFDDQFKADLIEDGMNPIRAWYWHKGVAKFGASSIRPSAEKLVLAAP